MLFFLCISVMLIFKIVMAVFDIDCQYSENIILNEQNIIMQNVFSFFLTLGSTFINEQK